MVAPAAVRSRVLAAVAACALAAGLAGPALAAENEADAYIRRGVKLLDKRDYRGALGQFRSAYDLAPTAPALARIGLAEQGLARWAEAEAHLEEALAPASDPWVSQNRRVLEGALEVVRSHLGTIELAGSPRGALVRLDGEVKGILPLARPMRVEIGERRVEVAADGHETFAQAVQVRTGERVRLGADLRARPVAAASAGAVEPAAAGAAPPGPPPARGPAQEDERGGASWRRAGWACVTAGALIAAAGAYLVLRRPYTTATDMALGVSGLGAGIGAVALGVVLVTPPRDGGGVAQALAPGLGLRGRF